MYSSALLKNLLAYGKIIVRSKHKPTHWVCSICFFFTNQLSNFFVLNKFDK